MPYTLPSVKRTTSFGNAQTGRFFDPHPAVRGTWEWEVRPALLEALRTVAPPDRKQMIPLPIVLLADPLPRGGGSFGTGKSSLVSAVQPGLGPTWMVSGTVFEKWLGSL